MERSPLKEYFRQLRGSIWRDGSPKSEQEMQIAVMKAAIDDLNVRLTHLEARLGRQGRG